MRFLPLLRGGATPKFTAEAFLNSFNKRSQEECNLSFEHAADFINDCFSAINLKLATTADDVESKLENFQWPLESLQVYVFMYKKIMLAPVERFLYEICIQTQKVQEKWIDTHKEELTDNYMEEYLTPLELLVQLIAVWHIACKKLLNPESAIYLTTYFKEPLARISFQLLRGVTYLRRLYHTELPLLDNVCDSLLRTAQLGIMYPEAHEELLSGLLKMFVEDFHVLYEFSHSSVDFYYDILYTECPKTSYECIYESFIELLQKYGVNHRDVNIEDANAVAQQRSLTVTNFMVDPKMLNAYYHAIVKRGHKALTLTVLDFIDVLQSKLISLDCFSEVFMEGVLDLVLSLDKSIGKKAAKLYINMMQRHSDAESTFKHIIGFYYVKTNTPVSITLYVQRLRRYFRPIQNINYYAECLQQRSVEAEPARIIAAHFAVAVFNLMLKEHDSNDETIVGFLRKLLDILKDLKCQTSQGILLDAFDAVLSIDLQNQNDDIKEIFKSLEEWAQHLFVSLENLQYPLLSKWFLTWENSASQTENTERIDESAITIVSQYTEYMRSKQGFFQNANGNEVRKYRVILQRLCLSTQSNHYTLNKESRILKDLALGLMKDEPAGNGIFYEYAFKFKDLIDVYALEIYTIGLIKLYNTMVMPANSSEYKWLKCKVQELEKHLRSWIQNTEDVKQPIVRVKTLLCCFLELHIIFGTDPRNQMLKLNMEIYEIVVRLITHLIFTTKESPTSKFSDYDEDSQVHTQRSLTYQRLIVERFANFHKCIGEQINSHYIWHFCLYYGLPQSNKFKSEMNEFMQMLAQNFFPIFKRVIPIIIFNLYTLKLALHSQTILIAIKAHKTFVDNLTIIEDRSLLNVSIVISVIERVDVSLKYSKLDNRRDRLASLQHLHKFVENLDLSSGDRELIKEIHHYANNLRRYLLSKAELKTMENFLNHFRV